jgi:hypothetical protein
VVNVGGVLQYLLGRNAGGAEKRDWIVLRQQALIERRVAADEGFGGTDCATGGSPALADNQVAADAASEELKNANMVPSWR